MDSKILKAIRKTAASCAAAAIILSGSSFGAFAADPGLPGSDVLAAGQAGILNGTTTAKTTAATTATKTTASTNNTATTTTSSTLGKPTLKAETKFSNDNTHPYGAQTNKLRIRWSKVKGATGYQISIRGGKYKDWTTFGPFSPDYNAAVCKGLARNTSYQFRVRAVKNNEVGPFSATQTLKTGRIDYDAAGWKAMCRIVYHEVGKSSDSCWDEPIVHVADCVVNRYEAAKYLNDPLWAPFYKGYNSVQSMIYQSGGFMSDSGLANDGASYSNVSAKVKYAVYGALYNKVTVGSIKHNNKIYYWQNTSYKPSGSKVAYVYPIPWGGYFSIWREYWG